MTITLEVRTFRNGNPGFANKLGFIYAGPVEEVDEGQTLIFVPDLSKDETGETTGIELRGEGERQGGFVAGVELHFDERREISEGVIAKGTD